MRDFVSCFNENAVQVSDTSCSSYSNIAPDSIPSIQNTVTSSYKTILSSQKQILIILTWSKNNLSQNLNITFCNDLLTSLKLNTSSRIFRKLKGKKSVEFQSHKIEVFWDLSTARYESGPEPVDGFYVFITVDSEIGLALDEEALLEKVKTGSRTEKLMLVSRHEHFLGNTMTRVRFSESGSTHDISVRFSGDNEGVNPVLFVTIDKKAVIRVKRLHWNFRGNQTVSLDGLVVDIMWDVHNWFYNPSPGSEIGLGVFMFRTRSGLDSRLWLNEKLVQENHDSKVEFSLMIYASKNK